MSSRLDGLRPEWVDTADGVERVAAACARAGRFALDTEADSLHSYFHKVCLVQVTAARRTWLVDPLAVSGDGLTPLLDVVGDATVPVVMHGADYDIRVLDRDFGARIHGLEDTQIMAQLLGEEKTGLAALLEREFGVVLDKKMQRADWAQRPLPRRLLQYAAADTAFLEELATRLRSRLEELGRWGWVVEECQRLEEVRHSPSEPDPLDFERVKGARGLKGVGRDRLYTLYEWREGVAQTLDVPPFKVLGNRPMIRMAESAPASAKELAEIHGVGDRFVRRWGGEVMEHLRDPSEAPARRRSKREPPPSAEVKSRLQRLLKVRDRKAKALGLEPGLVFPRARAQQIAACERDLDGFEDLEACGLEGWRLEVLGDAVLEAVES